MGDIVLAEKQIDKELIEYEKVIKDIGSQYVFLLGEHLSRAKEKIIELTGDKRAPGFLEWGKRKFNYERSMIGYFIKAYETGEIPWGKAKSYQSIGTNSDIINQQVKKRVKPGDIWQLGEHRLYCLDSSNKGFWDKLPDVPFIFADPPYNADAAGWDNSFNWNHDWLSEKAEIVAVTPGISAISDFFKVSQMPYRWSMACWLTNGMTRGALGFGNWIYTALFSNQDSIHRNTQDFFKIAIKTSESEETDFKGRKPSDYIAHLLSVFCHEGDCIVDPFLGSGTTLIVAEQLKIKCIGAEIEPLHCDIVLDRWEALTEKKAKRAD